MDGRPVQEVLPALNQQIAAQLAQRGLPEDWLKIELSPDSNPKARIDAQPETPGSLRSVLSMLGDPIIDRGPFGVNRGRYRYVLPSAIQLLKKASLYREDKEPLSLHDDAFAGQAVRATLTRYPGRDDAPETFRVEWLCDLHPELPRVSEALDLIHRTLPHEAAAGSVTCIDIQRAGASWRRCARATAVTRFIRYPILISDPPLTLIGKRPFLITLDDKTINEASKWNFTGNPPLELKAPGTY